MKKDLRITKLIKTGILTMAIAMGVGSFSPALTAQAKTAPRLNYTSIVLQCGQKKRLKLKGAKSKTHFYANSKFVTVNSKTGTISARSVGNTVVKAKAGKKTYKCKVSVIPNRTTQNKDVKITYTLKKNRKSVDVGKFNVISLTVKNSSKSTPITISNLVTVYNDTTVNDNFTFYEFRNKNTVQVQPGTTKTIQYKLAKGFVNTKELGSITALYRRSPMIVKVSHDLRKSSYSYWEQLEAVCGTDVRR